MRRIGLLCLLSSVSLADPLVEVSSTQFVGSQVDLAAIAVADGYLPSVISQREANRGHWRSVSLGLATADQTKFDGVAAGMDRYGGGVLLAIRQADEILAVLFRYEGRYTQSTEQGRFPVTGLTNTRLLRIAGVREGPLLVVAHDGGLALGVAKPRGRARVDSIAVGAGVAAATEPFAPARENVLFAVAPGRLFQLVQDGDAWKLAGEHRLLLDGFVPHAIAGEGKDLWIAGERGGHAMLLRLDARNPAGPGFPIDLGAGSAEKLALLEGRDLAVAGAKDGRAWVGVLSQGPRPAIAYESFVKGTVVTALGLNPARKGWSLAVTTPDGTMTLLRLPKDPALPRDWDPFTVPPPPEPPPVPAPQPGPEPEEAQPELPVNAGGARRAFAVLPRAQAQRGGAVDTEIVLVNLGQQRMQVVLRYVPDEGRGGFTRVTIEPGKRAKVSLADTLLRRRWGANDFDGYVRIDGGDRDDLVVDAVIRRQGQPPEDVRPHWR
ncbi:MAG TPA: hypothetical protein VFY93_08675 [Planctomycetota bacterium]|nr:hypothetical protein [Planctomycetota bacterium]